MLQLLFGEGDLLGSDRRFAFGIAPKGTGKTRSVRAAASATSSGFAALVHMVQGQSERELPVGASRLGGQYRQARGLGGGCWFAKQMISGHRPWWFGISAQRGSNENGVDALEGGC